MGHTVKDVHIQMGTVDRACVKEVAKAMIAHSKALEALAKSLHVDCSNAIGIKMEAPYV
jgi:hypothetical protein